MDNTIKIDLGTSGGMSLFIPYVDQNVTYDQMRYVFEQQERLGVIRHINFVKRIREDGVEYNMAYVYFDYWYNTKRTRDFQTSIQPCHKMNKVYFSRTRYWKVLASKQWYKDTYGLRDLIKFYDREVDDLKYERDLYIELVNKYRELQYNEDFECIFHRDMREHLGCERSYSINSGN